MANIQVLDKDMVGYIKSLDVYIVHMNTNNRPTNGMKQNVLYLIGLSGKKCKECGLFSNYLQVQHDSIFVLYFKHV